MRSMAGPRLVLLLVLLVTPHARGTCVKLPGCTCQLGPVGDREVQCGANPDTEETGIIAQVKPGAILKVQCTFNTTSQDLEMLSGMRAGPVQTIQFNYCPLPSSTFSVYLEKVLDASLNSTNTFVFQSHRDLGPGFQSDHLKKFYNVTRLALSSNQLTTIPEDLLSDMAALSRLDLRDNELTRVPPGLLKSSPRLADLELGNNKITEISFNNLTTLRQLNLWQNKLLILNSTSFDTLENLQTLDLNSNGLETLPQEIFYNLPKLNELNLSANNLSSLPEGLFSKSKNLNKLRLSENRSPHLKLPNGFLSELPKLSEVIISRSHVVTLPSDFLRGATALVNLTLDGNLMSTIPEGTFKDAVNLTRLDLNNNQLENLPSNVFNGLVHLKILRLGKNRLRTLPEKLLQSLERLEELDLSNNELISVDGAFEGVPNLRVARLANNRLTFEGAPFDYFGSYSPLRSCIFLRELLLANNSISEVFADWKNSMIKLHKLDLSYNNFTYIAVEDLHFLSEDLSIDLRHNRISVMDMRNAEIVALSQAPVPVPQPRDVMMPHHENKRSVRALVSHNPFNCSSCAIYNLLRYSENRMIPEVRKLIDVNMSGVRCSSDSGPTSGLKISQISSLNFTCAFQDPKCPNDCDCFIRPADKTIHLKCCHEIKNIPEISRNINRTEYSLEHCGITLPPNIYQISNQEKITALFLGNNNISQFRVKHLPESAEILELHNNNLSTLSEAVVRHLRENATRLQRLTLSGNPWLCDCDSRDMLAYVHEYFQIVPDLANVTCHDGRQLSKLSASDLCFETTKVAVAASMAIAAAGILLGAAAALYYRYQQEIKVWLYARNLCLWLVTEDELDKDKKYDAFVSYSHKDEDFVAQHLVPGLEPPFKLCIHVRDWVAGDWIPEQIARSVANSRRTLVILSPSFIDSVWGRMEFRAAHQQALSEGRVRVIVILLDDVGPIDKLDPELRAYLTMNTYLQWGDPWFWDKLRYALPHRPDMGPKDSMGWGWGRRRVQDDPSGLPRRVSDKLELMCTGVDLGSMGVITTQPSSNNQTPPSAVAHQNGSCLTNGHTRLV